MSEEFAKVTLEIAIGKREDHFRGKTFEHYFVCEGFSIFRKIDAGQAAVIKQVNREAFICQKDCSLKCLTGSLIFWILLKS